MGLKQNWGHLQGQLTTKAYSRGTIKESVLKS